LEPFSEAFLGSFSRFLTVAVLSLALAGAATAQSEPRIRLDASETVFATFAALNACGYDSELSQSDPLRERIRTEVAQNVARSPEAQAARQQLCAYYTDHVAGNDVARDLAQYVSLALNLSEPPRFELTTRAADLPPDAAYVFGFLPLLRKFYDAAGIHGVWQRHEKGYDALIARNSEAISRMRFEAEIYLKLASASYRSRGFTVYLEPMEAPGHVNSRNYGAEYFLVVAPDAAGRLPISQIRHTFLHYILDPMAIGRQRQMKRLEPLLEVVQSAPLDESFKYDISLLVTESLIQAIEARTLPGGKEAEPKRVEAMRAAMAQGYVLTRYFYDALVQFEKGAAGFNAAFPDMLHYLSVDGEKKRARGITFAAQGPREVVRAKRSHPYERTLDIAESRLAAGDVAGAREYAQQAFDQKSDDPARAAFILARCAILESDVETAEKFFRQTIEIATDPRIVAWSHIYLGRIFDMQDEREQAVTHYQAALAAGDTRPDTKKAAERGLAQPYQPASPRQ